MGRVFGGVLLLLLLAGYGLLNLWQSGSFATNARREAMAAPLVFYTAMGATTPQLPFWAAVRGGWPAGRRLETRYWKDLDDLRGVMMAGRGDFWLGHVEGFAQAARHGAPVTLVAVTGWRKFQVLTVAPDVNSLTDLAVLLARTGEELAVTPADSPAFALLEDMARRGGPPFVATRHDTRLLALRLLRGDQRHVVAPEPLASMLCEKLPALRRVASLEQEHARYAGGSGMLPLAGLAVRTDLLREHPALVAELLSAMVAFGAGPSAAVPEEHRVQRYLDLLPADTVREIGDPVLRRSLDHDPVRVEPAAAVRGEVLRYLSLVMPEGEGGGAPRLPDIFFGIEP